MFGLLSFLIFFIATILQVTIIPRLVLYGAIPNLVLVLIIIWSVLFGFKKSFWLALIAGITLDLFSGAYFGTFTFSFLLITFLVDLATTHIFSNNFLLSALTFCSIFTTISVLLADYLAYKTLIFDYRLLIIFIVTLFFNLFLTLILFPLINKFANRMSLYEQRVKLPY
jgi:rod shape-determining protein MreD